MYLCDANGCAPSIFSGNVPEPGVLEIDSFTSTDPSCYNGNDGYSNKQHY